MKGEKQKTTMVGVISDTHGTLNQRAYEALAECDLIIHAGDIGGPEILRELRTLAPVVAVLGNNDFAEYGKEVGRFAKPVVGGVRFLVAHYPQEVHLTGPVSAALGAGETIPDVCIHGHTHQPRLECGAAAGPASFVINPGSASRPRGGHPRSVAKIAIEAGQVRAVRIESLTGETLMGVGEWTVPASGPVA